MGVDRHRRGAAKGNFIITSSAKAGRNSIEKQTEQNLSRQRSHAALIFVAIILVFRDALPDIVKDLSAVPFRGVLILLSLGFAYEAMESMLCLVIIHHKKPDCTFITRCA